MSPHRVARSVAQFALSGLVAVLVLGLIGVQVLRATGRAEAVRDAKTVTSLAGEGIVEPHVTRALVAGDPRAVAGLDRVVRARVLEGPVVRVKLWDARGRIVYSDVPTLIGSRYPLGHDELDALRGGTTDAGVSDLAKPENRFERRYHKLLEVYKGIRGADGQPLLLEAYLRYSSVSASGRRLWLRFAPALLGGLLLLEVIQIPLAYLLARRLRERERERQMLLQRAVDASELERRRLAAELHDGPVQSLAGVAFSLAGAAERMPQTSNGIGNTVRDAAQRTRDTMRELRAMLVGLYPPTLHRSGLAPALADLVATATAAGIDTDCRVDSELALAPEVEAVVFRAAREALQNAVKHAHAEHVELDVHGEGDRLVLSVSDDGIGFVASEVLARPEDGHIGLRLVRDLATEVGGSVTIESTAGVGTEVRLEVQLA